MPTAQNCARHNYKSIVETAIELLLYLLLNMSWHAIEWDVG